MDVLLASLMLFAAVALIACITADYARTVRRHRAGGLR
jgi:hypothetical protein